MAPSTIFILVFAFVFGVVESDSDPCSNKTYKPINNPYRSTEYKLKPSDVAICDSNLLRGWYRFTSIVGGKMPENKTAPYHCGTVAPIWVNGTHPTVTNETKTVTACTNINDQDNGCTIKESILIKNCGGFFVYRLDYTDGCSMAYCAGHKKPCPKGLHGIDPNCQKLVLARFPEDLVPKPWVTYRANKEDANFTILCKFDFPSWTNVSFAVEWFADNRLIKKEIVCEHENVKQFKCVNRESDLHPNKTRAGHTLRCSIRMRYTTHPSNNFTEKWKSSDPYYAGIEVDKKHIVLKDCGTNETIFFKPTFPLFHVASRPHRFKLVKHVAIAGNKGILMDFHDCQEIIYSEKNKMSVTLRSICDDLKKSKDRNLNYVDYRLQHQTVGHTFWTFKYQASFRVTRITTDLKKCRSHNDPYIKTFDKETISDNGKLYSISSVGDYVLYKNHERDIEVI